MSEMVERVARALCGRNADQMVRLFSGPLKPVPNWKSYVDQARLAIEAMREPTDAMAKAGSNTIDEKMPDAKALRQVLYIWADMIDEALK